MNMGKILSALRIFKNEGLVTLIQEIGRYLLISSVLSPYLRVILGKRLQQKFYGYFQLGYLPNIQNPTTYNEKILHRKIYTNNNFFSILSDKYKVRNYVKSKVGEEILTDLYYITDDPETIPFSELPNEYVIKPTHLSGPVIISNSDRDLDNDSIIKSCEKWINTTHCEALEEYWYWNIKPRILVEERLNDSGYYLPRDFKFYVFHGEVKAIGVYQKISKDSDKRLNYYSKSWEKIDIVEKGYNRGPEVSRPDNLDEMLNIAETLGGEFDHIRVDLYNIDDNNIFFGEMTVAEASGGNPFIPQKYDYLFGSFW